MKLKKKFALIILSALLLSAFSFTAAAQAEPSGAYLKFSVDVDKTNEDGDLAFNYYFIVQNLGYVLQAGDTLEYDVWLSIEETGWGHIDGDIDGANLRDRGFSDHEGTNFHTGQDISHYAHNQWWRRSVELGTEEYAGGTLNSIQLSMHPSVPDDLYSGYALYDNIVITNNGEIQLVIFRDEGDLDPDAFSLSHQRGSTSTVELLIFTQEELDAFAEAEAEKIRIAEEREAERIAAAEERDRLAAERAVAEAEEAERIAAEQAEAERLAAEQAEQPDTGTSGSTPETDDDGLNIGVIIGIAAGVIAVIVIIIIIARKKKSG